MTVEQFVSDIELQAYQGAISDDAELDKRQIKFWGSYFLNMLVATECNSKIARDEQIPVIYKKRATCKVPEQEDVDCTDDCNDRVFVTLPEDVLTLNKDAGIIRVSTDEGDMVTKMSVETIDMIRYMPYASPSLENLVYYRQGQLLFVEGFKPVDLPFTELNIDYVPKQNLLELEDSDEFLVSDLVAPQLIAMTVDQAKRELYGTQQDQENDGQDNKKLQYHTAIKSGEQQLTE